MVMLTVTSLQFMQHLLLPLVRNVYDTDDLNLEPIQFSCFSKLSVNSVVSLPVCQMLLSSKVKVYCFQGPFDQCSPATKAISF